VRSHVWQLHSHQVQVAEQASREAVVAHDRHILRLRSQSIQQTRQLEGRDAAKVILRGKLEVDRHDALELLPRNWRARVVVGAVNERPIVRRTRLDEPSVALESSFVHRLRAHAPGHSEAERAHCVRHPFLIISSSNPHRSVCLSFVSLSACPRISSPHSPRNPIMNNNYTHEHHAYERRADPPCPGRRRK